MTGFTTFIPCGKRGIIGSAILTSTIGDIRVCGNEAGATKEVIARTAAATAFFQPCWTARGLIAKL